MAVLNWNNIRPINGSQNEGFEELVCQLARRENISNRKKFIRKGKPDAGVECYWIFENGDEIAWQAKFFLNSFGDSQWSQIEKSVRTVLTKHPKLKKYYIAVPYDPSDGRLENQKSMLEKWNLKVESWQKFAKEKEMEVEFLAWWSSDLIEKLQKIENEGLLYFWFNKEEFTDNKFKNKIEEAIADLGTRYTPELNVELDTVKVFNALSRNEKFESEVKSFFNDVLKNGNELKREFRKDATHSLDFIRNLSNLEELYAEIDFTSIEVIPIDKIKSILSNLKKDLNKLKEICVNSEEQLNYERRVTSKAIESIEELKNFLESEIVKVGNNPFLILKGDAGVGKSHLLADVVNTRISEGQYSLLFLGQHFVTREDPCNQILKKMNLNCSFDTFLGALQSKAEVKNQRIIIYIDAVNEGEGVYFWKDYINSFILKIKRYEWLGLVMSVRTSYFKEIFSEETIKENKLVTYKHDGFAYKENEAIKIFFKNFEIELPSIPNFNPEFQNPLFLMMFCKGLQNLNCNKIPDGIDGITSVIRFFLNGINKKLAESTLLDYDEELNIVNEVLLKLVEYNLKNKTNHIPYQEASRIAIGIADSYGIAKRKLLSYLISEGALIKDKFDDTDSSYIRISYERFEDHLKARYIIEETQNLEKAFKKDGQYHYLVKDGLACSKNKGVLEALSIQLPELKSKELYEYISELENHFIIVECFIESLVWRKIRKIDDKLKKYIQENILKYVESSELFFETILLVSSNPNHAFNSSFLHKLLKQPQISMADRDALWTIYLGKKYYEGVAIEKLISWAWSDFNKTYISNEGIKLTAIALAWFLTSTNRKLRDSATKALVCILENRINVLIDLLKEFEGVNDPYVYERLFAVAYGCTLRTEEKDKLVELSNYIYKTIFKDKEEVYPHALLRDYANGVIEFMNYLGYNLEFNIEEVRPPYKSKLPTDLPSNEDIDKKYKLNCSSSDFNDYYWSQNSILNSMVTEYGRGICSYGDFGRYIFQRALYDWDVDVNLLSNLAVKWIFEKYGYDKEKHGEFDRYNIGINRFNERIGKKYQWLALHEMIARVSDNIPMKGEKKYQGSWDPYIRDIDPTLLIKGNGDIKEELNFVENCLKWSMSNEEWLKSKKDLPNCLEILEVMDVDKEKWLLLEGYLSWEELLGLGEEKYKCVQKEVWYLLKSYIVKDANYKEIKKWLENQNFMGRWMPESSIRYEMFSREYYWSNSYKYLNRENGDINEEILKSKKIEDNLIITTDNYLWENEQDMSKEKIINFLKPNSNIVEGMKLYFSKKEGEFIDKKGRRVCFDPTANNGETPKLFIRKDLFVEYLKKNKLRIIWTLLGEKRVLTDDLRYNLNLRPLTINGVYYLDKTDKLQGKFSKNKNIKVKRKSNIKVSTKISPSVKLVIKNNGYEEIEER